MKIKNHKYPATQIDFLSVPDRNPNFNRNIIPVAEKSSSLVYWRRELRLRLRLWPFMIHSGDNIIPQIGTAKPDIEGLKADIEKLFQPKTVSHILKLREAFPGQTIFDRSDVMGVIDIMTSRASDLLKDMAEHGIIEPVAGHGNGKYRFKNRQG